MATDRTWLSSAHEHLCRTFLGPSLSFFPAIPFCLKSKEETQEIFPAFETKEGAKYLERLAFRYMGAKKENLEVKNNDPKTVWKYSTSNASIRMVFIDY